jgi:phosphate transport system substrate-binding protein
MYKTSGLLRHTKFVALFMAVAAMVSPFARADFVARGSDSTLHVLKALAAAFEKQSGQAIKLEGGGSGAGAKAAIAGEVQLAFLSRGLSDGEKTGGLVGTTYAVDAVAVIANSSNPQADIKLAELKALYTGAADAWRDGRPAVLYNRNADSGTREVFSEIVLGKGVEFTPKASIKHDGILISSVTKIPTALAYTSVAEVDASVVKVLTVDGVAPTPDNLRNKSYPITRTPTLATKGAPEGTAKAFIDFVLSPAGQAVVAAEKLVPIK